ncbi:MAG TPA: hypothetical protein VLC53_11550, partial [Myxococcota bacterium]|nr:hypothetical protein [Myxococcota bacterium]
MRAWNPLPAARERQQARRFSLTALLAPLALAHAVAAEPIGPDAFGPDTDHIEFADFPSGTEISFQLSVHGARVRCASGPWLRVASAGLKPSPTPMLVAPAPGCTITASFLTPRRRVGLRLGPPMAATVATLTAFDAAGDPLDAVLAQLPGGGEGAFLGIGLPEPVIARVVLTASPEASLAVGALLAEPSQATGVGSLAALEAVFTSSQASEPLRIEALDAVRRSPSPQASALLQKALDDPARPYLQELAAEAL